VRDALFLKLTPSRESLKHPKGGKLSPRLIGPFQILEWIGAVTYRLDLSDGLMGIHDVFNVLQLKKCNPNPKYELNEESLHLLPNLSYVKKPKEIL
jgi:hypothetical protein